MKMKHLGIFVLIMIVTVVFVYALPDTSLVATENKKSGVTVIIPKHAVEVADDVFDLGTTVDVDGRVVQGYMFIDRKKGYAKPGAECGNGICDPGENANKCPADCAGGDPVPGSSSCYSLYAKGAKWKTVEPYIVNPNNTRNLSSSFVTSNLASDIQDWETAAGVDILGSGSSTSDTLVADTESTDGVNEVYFADVDSPGAIAVTILWGIFFGPPFGRELVEWDQVYDDVDYNWSEDCTVEDCVSEGSKKMDFWNIAEHELGHTIGLGHPADECIEETMYRFAGFGETKKRTLAAGDITGVGGLYT